ncbi:hypothetical protein [Micromonospora sp. NPDC047074]|uniref:hypothetical protein n=1 Tax=Micromonospora sp. NPDC047074 TaxID=3154339 RepID=UPI0033C82E18
MGWFLVVTPLHQAAENGAIEWAAEAEYSCGLPEEAPTLRALPTVEQVLLAFRKAGCHGTPWFQVVGRGVTEELPECPGAASCVPAAGLDLGEVRLGVDGASPDEPVELHQAVTDIGFRKPSGRAVLAAAVALASQAGPLLVLDDSGGNAFVVSPGDEPAHLAEHWPW